MEILAVYSIHYPTYNVTQQKNLVDHARYVEIRNGMNDEENPLPKDTMKKTFGDEFFTTESPLGIALKTNSNLILPKNQGGEHKVNFIKL